MSAGLLVVLEIIKGLLQLPILITGENLYKLFQEAKFLDLSKKSYILNKKND
jgi:hypothetical protein